MNSFSSRKHGVSTHPSGLAHDGGAPIASRNFEMIRRLIYVYFILLIFEGAIRKWLLPGFSDYILMIRDPVAALILYYAVVARAWGSGFAPLLVCLGVLGALFALLGLVQAAQQVNLLVLIYGYRTYFLHLPVIFIMGATLHSRDVQKLCRWICLIAVAMLPLIVIQFVSSPDSRINTVAGGGGLQIVSAMGKIRTPGLFSYILGVVYFYSLALAVALSAEMESAYVSRWLRRSVIGATILVAALAGSRALLASLAIVFAAPFFIVLINRTYSGRTILLLILMIFGLLLASLTSIFRSGVEVTGERIDSASEGSNPVVNLVERVGFELYGVLDATKNAKLLGAGMGLGTNAGSKLTVGDLDFLLAEDEWQRIVLEVGPIIGLCYIAWRVALVCVLLVNSIKQIELKNILPFMLWSACAANIFMGQWGPPMNLGFAVFTAGMTLASMRRSAMSALGSTEPHFSRIAVANMRGLP